MKYQIRKYGNHAQYSLERDDLSSMYPGYVNKYTNFEKPSSLPNQL